MDREEIFRKISAVGRAALALDLENSHSGNISIKCSDERGNDILAITATGSMKGELTREKICYPALDKINFGHFKASTETDIHRRILGIPGLNATMHAHTKAATVVTLDDAPMPKENPRAPLVPVDPLGARFLGSVPVDWFAVASGSKEMSETVSKRLEDHRASMVQAHGVFAGGATLEEAFFYLCVLEHSGEVAYFSDMLGPDRRRAEEAARALAPLLKRDIAAYSNEHDARVDFDDEPETVEMFRQMGRRIFESRYSPFHTGSMSVRCSETMLYAPKAAMPHELPGPLMELPLKSGGAGDAELEMHRRIFAATPLKSIVHCYISECQAVSLETPPAGVTGPRKIIPIDAEGGFLYPSVPVMPPDPDPEELARLLLDYRVVIVGFGGVWAAGEQSVGEALRHISSVKDICYYRIMAKMRGMNISAMEPERARNW